MDSKSATAIDSVGEAVEFARDLLRDSNYSPESALRLYLSLLKSDAGEMYTDDGESVDHLTGEDANLLIPYAEKEPYIYEALCELSAELLLRDNQLPPDLRFFAAQVLIGERKPPKRKGGQKSELTAYKKAIIFNAVYQVCVKYSYKPTRDDASTNISGCDIVSMAQKSLRRSSPSEYDAIKKIFNSPIFKNIRQIRVAI